MLLQRQSQKQFQHHFKWEGGVADMGIKIKQTGNFKNLENFGKRVQNRDIYKRLNQFGQQGVAALSSATPKKTGKTARSWSYKIETDGRRVTRIAWYNSNLSKDWFPVAIMLQYGHGTRNGGYVEGIDYINPALNTVFQRMAEEIWKEVTR